MVTRAEHRQALVRMILKTDDGIDALARRVIRGDDVELEVRALDKAQVHELIIQVQRYQILDSTREPSRVA